MKNNTKLLLSALVACGGVLVACGDSAGTGGSGGATSSTSVTSTTTTKATSVGATTTSSTKASTSTGMMNPVPPTLGTQIDRMGRPAIDTATNQTFVATGGVVSTTALREAAEDEYNQNAAQATWTTYATTMATQLAVLDALDTADTADPNTRGCGNQLLAGKKVTAGAYDMLAGVLANDVLWVTTKTTATCNTYLGVEEKALGLAVDDCGGRRPADDVIKTTYTVVSGIQAASGFDDGITDSGNHSTTFPYLNAPH